MRLRTTIKWSVIFSVLAVFSLYAVSSVFDLNIGAVYAASVFDFPSFPVFPAFPSFVS